MLKLLLYGAGGLAVGFALSRLNVGASAASTSAAATAATPAGPMTYGGGDATQASFISPATAPTLSTLHGLRGVFIQ